MCTTAIIVIIIAIFIFVGSKKKPQRESDAVYYDTINTAHPPPIIDTELNIAYGNPKKLK